MNIVVLTGRLTADPELKYAKSGKAFVKYTLAVNRSYSKDQVDFINCIAWDKVAEIIGKYLRKGSMIGINGRISIRDYEDENNQKRRITEIVTESVEFLESKKDNSKGESYTENNYVEENNNIDVDDDFPF
ncbi:MAG: single-stranded DNA-binding protein [Fusobacteria bacterium]|nr:single-stranded DNA-binding protein [Fusobacteriota bacterium]